MKRKSLFSQIYLAVITLFIISIIIMGTLLFSFLGRFFTTKYERDLKEVADQIISITFTMKGNKNGISPEFYSMGIDAVAKTSNTEIFVVDSRGELVTTSIHGFRGKIKNEFTKDMLKGKEATYRGSIGGIFKTEMISVAKPIIADDVIVGGVLVSVPMPEVAGARHEILKIFLENVLLVAIIAALIAFLISKRLTKPLMELNNAAKKIADGDFKQRVSIEAQNELGELGETFNNMADSIEQLENMRSSFIANVSHDLRTPMTTIIGFVEGIMDGTIPPEKHEWYLSIVLDESKRLSRIVTDLLDLSKLEQGSFKIEMRDFDLNELIRLNIIKSEKRITEKNIQLSVGFKSENLRVTADKDAVQRVLTNLFDNAIKFTEEGGFIDVNTGIKDGKAYVSVQNSGVGIEKKELLHIFDRFYKTDKSRSLDKNGAGLGLYIVKSIISAHNERIWAESEPGKFTRFSFTLTPANENDKKTEEV